MLDKVIKYIKKNKVVEINKLKKDLSISDEDWDLILLQLKDLRLIKQIQFASPDKCNSCPYVKSCSQQCLQSEILYLVSPDKDQDSE